MSSKLQAIIFDLDGLLVDSEPLWYESRKIILDNYGINYTIEEKKKVMAGDYFAGLRTIIKDYGLLITEEEFAEEEKRLLFELYPKKLKYMPGAKRLLKEISGSNLPRAIATSSFRLRFDLTDKIVGLKGFEVVVTGEQIKNGKPAPDIYLAAAKRLKVDPKSCVVLEDAPFGAQAGISAGMKTVVVFDKRFTNKSDFTWESRPDLIVSSLKELSVGKLKELFE